MAKQDYILKKFVRAESASEALALDSRTPVSEAYLITDKPEKANTSAIGFQTVYPDFD